MTPNEPLRQRTVSTRLLNSRIAEALTLLREADEAARTVGRDTWEFAVEIGQLRAAGLTNADLRWLLCEGITWQLTVARLAASPDLPRSVP